ncbi:MAG: GPW/gp25 family protein [Actinobacteria bacterium]|nr:GPW/gp25 family protein [Actinomycetota bacterium]
MPDGGPVSSFRFAHPEWEPGVARPGLQVAPTGALELVDGPAAVRQSILLLLSTAPGERVMRPQYGCRIHWLVFALNNDTTAGLAIHYVRQALRRWEPRIDVLDVDANRDGADAETLVITIRYRLRATQELSEFVYPLRLHGEEV